MNDWRSEADDLLFEGEEIREAVDVEGNGLVVTSHRMLVFTPGTSGANFRQVDRPNVDRLGVRSFGTSRYLWWAVRPGVLGVILLFGGATISLDGALSSVDGTSAAGTGVGGIFQMVSQMATLLALLDDAMVTLGALGLLVVALLLGLYARSRTRVLRVVVAGGEDIDVPLDGTATRQLAKLESALQA